MRMLDRKLLRDLKRLYAQVFAIAMVMACGVATIIISVGAYRSLDDTRATFYDRYRFANVFASVTRAPAHLKQRISRIEGVSAVETRIVQSVLLDVEGMSEPATGLAISVPDHREATVNRLYMRKGRLPEKNRQNEVAVVEDFAEAHGLEPGNTFNAIMDGQKQTLKISGIVLSPEYIYSIGPGDMVPDPRRYAVFFMSEKLLSGLFDKEGAFDNVVLTTTRGTNIDQVIEALDDILKPYGSAGAYAREDQQSHLFLDAELSQLQGMAQIIPPIFLFVSAFLVNMVLTRLITLEREQVGLLKAIGYGTLAVGGHYAKLVSIIAFVGLLIGSVAGWWLGRGMAILYSEFFSFPFLIFRQSLDLYALAGGVTLAAALAGAARAILSIVGLPPAVAMRPPAPPIYRRLFKRTMKHVRIVSQLTTMAFRHLIRWPVRSALTISGTALSVALLVTALFSQNSVDHVIDTIFYKAERQDATITFAHDLGYDAITAVSQLPGVISTEAFRATSVILRNGVREERLQIIGVVEGATMARLLDLDLNPVEPTDRGLFLSERVGELLDVGVGRGVEIELLEKDGRILRAPVVSLSRARDVSGLEGNPLTLGQPMVGITQSYVGMTAYMHLDQLNRILLEGPRVSGARLKVDADQLDSLYREIKETPAIASIALQGISRDKFRETIDRNIQIMMTVYIVLSVIMTFGVIYNSARIQLSERARELASLRVFGFTRAEVSSVLLMELAVIVAIAQPFGWLIGYGFSYAVSKGFESDAFRVPLIVNSATFATASLIVFVAAVISAVLVRRRIDQLDLVQVLKTRE